MKQYTIASNSANELTIKKSRFIASLHPVQSERSVKETLTRIKQEHRNATHHPYAYRIGFDSILERCADDGEPPKSSGLPILQELQNAFLTNALLVVTRYFGGTKLGLGGLNRAYRESASQVIKAARQIPAIPVRKFKVSFDPRLTGKIRGLLHRFNAKVMEEIFDEQATFIVAIERSLCDQCTEAINNLAKGKVTITRVQLPIEE